MNAKQELLDIINRTGETIKCASIDIHIDYSISRSINLPLDYSPNQYEEFLSALDVEYDNGYGGQELYGRVWLTGNMWLDRWEYDGSEGWKISFEPIIPDELLDINIPIFTTVTNDED